MPVIDPSLFPTGGLGSSSPNFDATVLTQLSAFLQQIKSSLGADDVSGLTTLRQDIETIEKKGALSEGDLQKLEGELATIAENPMLSGPDQTVVNAFITELKGLPSGTVPLTGPSNPFLDCSALLELFQMTAKITTELSKIQYKEAMQRIHEMEMQMEAAKEASVLTKEAGEVAAEKDIIQANAEFAQAGMALASGIVSAVTSFYGTHVGNKAYAKSMADSEKGSTPGNAIDRMKNANAAATQASAYWMAASHTSDQLSAVAKDFANAVMHKQLSSKEIEEATLKAAAGFLDTLSKLQEQAASTLGQSISSLDQEIKAFFEKYIEAMRGWSQAWGRG